MGDLRDWGICQHTEHAVGEAGRVGRWFPGGLLYGNPAGKWEPCAQGENVDVRIAEAERRAAVNALRDAAAGSYNYDEVSYYADSIDRRAEAIENGADL